MPQHTPHQVNAPDNSDSSEYESDSGPGSVGASSISQPSALNGRMPRHEDMEIIRRLQLENQTLKNNNRALGETNKTLSANQRRSSSSTQIPDELKAFDAELATFSRKYGIIAEMFPPTHRILKLPVPKPPPAILSGSRYATKSAEELCLITELYSLLPDHLHRFVPTTHFQSLLGQHLQGGRSSEIGKLRVMAGRIFGLDSSYFDTSFTKRDTIPDIQNCLVNHLRSFHPSFLRGKKWTQRCQQFSPRAKCNARKWGITSCTPGLLAWGWVALIFILSSDTSFTKDGVGARSRLPYAAMFTAYKQLWVTLWEEPRIISIRQKIDTHVWQSSTSNVAASEAEGEDFTSDLMRLALANAGRKDSDSPTINEDPAPPTTSTSPTIDTPVVIAPPVPPTVQAITPATSLQATETIINPVPISAAVQLPVSLTGNTNVPIVAVTTPTALVPAAAVTALVVPAAAVTAVVY
ncbi:hypothetical protein DFJ58DRAFT_843936 [Suillus subalutaceus]|uniref:uncharacterized protein n=1 Tax=Suillus subalutaceus TaxID=48586 RepID=UPI001B866115|nr:uncharacterized protein DFJ58DRAFT_843936 [Suillus subalutaceus]KAG1844844.1 hypothetical protein DFJ58DRAFT_843936 [Suillus subalutaceus]